MGFIDEAAGGGGPPIMKFNKEAQVREGRQRGAL